LADVLEAAGSGPDAEPDVDVEPEPEPEAEAEAEVEPGPEPEPGPDRASALESDVERELASELEPDVEPEPEADPADDVVDDARPVVVTAPRRSRWTRTRVTFVAVLVAVAASALALTKAQQVGNLTAQRDDRRDIEVVAERFGSAYLSFDFEHVEDSAGAVRALATRSFAASYTAQSAPGIQQLFSSRQTRTRATTTAVYLGEVHSRTARALVVVDVTATSPTDGDQRLDDVSFVLDLARTDDGWRVAKVDRAPQPSLDDGSSSTTAAPPP
jgi:hypothetical protein